MGLVLTVMKWVHIAYGSVDMEEEIEHTSYLLEVVWDEAMVVSE